MELRFASADRRGKFGSMYLSQFAHTGVRMRRSPISIRSARVRRCKEWVGATLRSSATRFFRRARSH